MAACWLRRIVPRVLIVWCAAAPAWWPEAAVAQMADPDVDHGERRVAVGGEVTVVASPREDTGFFNYTDYAINRLQSARVRLFGEWRLTSALSAIGELRSDNGADLITAHAYLRWRPSSTAGVTFQAGRIPPVFGAFSRRAYGRDNLTLSQPLGYQYLTSLRPDALPATTDDLLRMRGRGWEPSFPIGADTVRAGIPLVSLATWDTGVEATWHRGALELAGAVTRGSPAVPVVRETNGSLALSGRAAWADDTGLTVGVSAARGQWTEDVVLDLTARGRQTPAFQTVLGGDVEYGSGPWLVRGEWMHARFDLPIVAAASVAVLSADALFVEGRYRIHPRWQLAGRADYLTFSDIRGSSIESAASPWDAPTTRVEGALGIRITRAFEVRAGLQQNWRSGGRVRRLMLPAVSLLYWF
jgi:hypothetical protein